LYILLEGIDGVGKSTQINALRNFFPNSIITKEPGGSPLGEVLRDILLMKNNISKRAEILLFLADRAEHFSKVISPNLDKLILSDRGFISGIAYALANENLSFDELIWLNKFALQNTLPNKIVLFYADEKTLKNRLISRINIDSIENRGFEYLLKVQDIMKDILQNLKLNHIIINANESERKITNLIKDFIND
jgi:dTMP kinase